MSAVEILDVQVCDNPASFLTPFKFQITFECREAISQDLEWKIIYVGSAENDEHDQELESVLVGPVPVGTNTFTLEARPPDGDRIPRNDILGVTVVLLTCSYVDKEFIRVGYYVNNEYADEHLREEPPAVPELDKIVRLILADKPKVTRFPIDWQNPQHDPNLDEIAKHAGEDAADDGENDMDMAVEKGGVGSGKAGEDEDEDEEEEDEEDIDDDAEMDV